MWRGTVPPRPQSQTPSQWGKEHPLLTPHPSWPLATLQPAHLSRNPGSATGQNNQNTDRQNLVLLPFTTSGQETERVYSYNTGVHTGLLQLAYTLKAGD